MDAIKATWTNGRIVPDQPIDWPEGSPLLVERIHADGKAVGLTEDEWRDDPEAIAAWIAAVENIEPMFWEDGEEEAYQRFREKARHLSCTGQLP